MGSLNCQRIKLLGYADEQELVGNTKLLDEMLMQPSLCWLHTKLVGNKIRKEKIGNYIPSV